MFDADTDALLPLIFIHRSRSWYLWYVLRQARLTNPHAPIYLICDDFDPAWGKFATHIDIDAFSSGAKQFAKEYCHLSTNPLQFELFCFERWFILLEFLKNRNLQRCIYMDSDVMMYSDMNKAAGREPFAFSDLTFLGPSGPPNGFINNLSCLQKFCEYMVDSYTQPEMLKVLQDVYAQHRSNGLAGGICDMTLFKYFRQHNPSFNYASICEVQEDSVYDDGIKATSGFESRNGLKVFTWRQNKPYCRELQSGKLILFHVIHLQAETKLNAPWFCTHRNSLYYKSHIFIQARRIGRKIVSFLRLGSLFHRLTPAP